MTFYEELDGLLIGIDGGEFTYFPDGIEDPKNPTKDEIMRLTKQLIYERGGQLFADILTIYLTAGIVSTDGQEYSEDPELRGEVDFEEQALYYEAIFSAVEDETWIDGFISEGWDWFDQYKRPEEGIYYDQTGSSSPRNKPAEEVIKIWHDST